MPIDNTSRRIFLAAATALPATRVHGANTRIRIGVVGTGGRGQWLMKALAKTVPEEFQIVAVCDVYDVRRAQAAQLGGPGVEQYLDYRQLIARSDVDAVIVATPDHWHSAVAVDAMNAGKDVYIEKPMVHYPKDGLAIIKAARANKRVVQVGMQGRMLPQFTEAKRRYIDSGVMGKVGVARTWYNSNSGYVLKPPSGFDRKPDGLDWERWTGPGPKVPWNPGIYFSPYKWLHYDGGMIMGIGIHVIDSAHHWLSLRQPAAAIASGGIYHFKDGRDTPDVIHCVLEYPQEVSLTFSAECLTATGVSTSAGVELRGTGGVLMGERYAPDAGYTYTPYKQRSPEPAAKVAVPAANAELILKNWLECIRDRKRTVANEEEGYFSAMACFLANQAYRTRARVAWDKAWDLPA
ncbi:MAG: Gfo/Idh/MocA family oxidoreductase [Acidobacteria bacterium]|nr:Gfo/Idh/MocA family oxidoreductase [Acidobacteriota bacterium]